MHPMLIVALISSTLAVALHAFIFYLESFRWTADSTRRVFSIATAEEAAVTKEMAFNQGFYNLFLGIIAGVGCVIALSGNTGTGCALMLAGTGSMLAAGLVLFCSSPDKRAAAIKQVAFPALAIASMAGYLVL